MSHRTPHRRPDSGPPPAPRTQRPHPPDTSATTVRRFHTLDEFRAAPREEVVGPSLWVLAVLAWGVGDLATTWAGYQTAHAVEATAFVDTVIERWEHAGHALVKAFWLSMGALYYRRLPAVLVAKAGVEERVGRVVVLSIPLAFAVVGLALTLGNLDVLLVGGRP